MLLAGDIGGTKTNLALFDLQDPQFSVHSLRKYPSMDYPNLRTIVKEYLADIQEHVEGMCITHASFAIAGPVQNNQSKATNLPWIVDASELSKYLSIPRVELLNDVEANAYAIDILETSQLYTLHPGTIDFPGNRALISPGTGLGEAGLYWDGEAHQPFATEGGHCEFGPRDEMQIDLCRFIYKRYGHASYERVLSGPGIHLLYDFLKEVCHRKEKKMIVDAFQGNDPSKVITENALNNTCPLCVETLDIFTNLLGSECGNCFLRNMAFGGIYLGGGIPPKILPKLEESPFLEGFLDKGRFRSLLEEIPISVILDDKAGP